MVRLLLLENDLNKQINNLFSSNVSHEVGLIIGQFSESKDFAVHLAKCPEEELVDNESKDDGGDSIHIKWVIEHARQVNRMLTGGIMIIGIYSFSNPNFVSKNQTILKQCLFSVCKKIENNKWIRKGICHNDRYFLHICPLTKKLTCRAIDMQDEQASLKPVEHRFQSFLSGWHCLTCYSDLNVDSLVPIKEVKTYQKVLFACQEEIEEIWNSFAVVNQKIVKNDQFIAGNKNKTKHNGVKDIHLVLFKQKKLETFKELMQSEKVNASIKFIGTIASKAFLHQKATFGEAINAIKVDITRSLQARIELLVEEVQVNNLCQVDEWSLMSPTRVFAMCNNIFFGDYAFKDETQDEILGRFSELLSLKTSSDCLQYLEKSPDISDVSMILRGEKLSDANSDAASELSSVCYEEPSNFKLIASCIIAVVAVLFSLFSLIFRK